MFLSVVACFKNESHILKEWIDHYQKQGVDQFLLCDNNSTDNYQDILDKYDNIILYKDSSEQVQWGCEYPRGEYGKGIYSKMISENKTEWAIICDLDEFMYAREGYDTIRQFLEERGSEFNQLLVPNILFHNRGGTDYAIKEQPESVVDTFVRGRKYSKKVKAIVKTSEIEQLNIHEHAVKGRSTRSTLEDDYELTKATATAKVGSFKGGWRLYPESGKVYIHSNHYQFQSEDYYFTNKLKRGYADRDNEEAVRKRMRMKEWQESNAKEYEIDTELKDLKSKWNE